MTNLKQSILNFITCSRRCDSRNPDLMFQSLDPSLLKGIACGHLDAVHFARQEMVHRGLGKNGTWVGFDDAAREWCIKF